MATLNFHLCQPDKRSRAPWMIWGFLPIYAKKDLGISACFGEKDLGISHFHAYYQAYMKKRDVRDDPQKKNL